MLCRTSCMLICAALLSVGQVYSPTLTKKGQVDATSLESLAKGIYEEASAITPRKKAEAIWRFFLTDGRFVKPGFWYHIAGWAYEEPKGEVLDPIKLLNSYGFGLCYHIAPLLEAVFEAGGFPDARVWFLTGHTVAEVFYDGGYHYFDSDMLGYNPVGSGPLKQRPVASVRQIEEDGNIVLSKLAGPKKVDTTKADYPWYPADVRENAIPELAALFTTTGTIGFFRSPVTPKDTLWITLSVPVSGSYVTFIRRTIRSISCPGLTTAKAGVSSRKRSRRIRSKRETAREVKRIHARGGRAVLSIGHLAFPTRMWLSICPVLT